MTAQPLGKLSKLDIINDALMHAKIPSISSLDDPTEVYARIYSQQYDTSLAELLMNTPSSFSITTTTLKQSVEKPNWYVLPADFLKILPPYQIYEREGEYVKANSSGIKYIRLLDSSLFPPMFTTLLTMS